MAGLVLAMSMAGAAAYTLSAGCPPAAHAYASSRSIPPRLQEPPEGDERGDGWDSSLAVLSERLAKVREVEREERVGAMAAAAANWRTGRCAQRTLVLLDEWVRRLHCIDGLLACGTYSGEVVLVEMASGEILESWGAPDEPLGDDGPMSALDDSSDDPSEITAIELCRESEGGGGVRVVTGDASGAVALRQRGTAEPLIGWRHKRAVSGVHCDVESQRVYSSSLDGSLRCHDMRDGGEVGAISFRKPVLCMSVCGEYASVGLSDGTVCVCTLSPLRQILSFSAHKEATSAVAMLSGSQLLSGCADGSVCLWRLDEDLPERRCLTFTGHRGPVVCLQGDVEKVVSGARDGTVRVWEAASGKSRFVLQGFTAYLGSLVLTPTSLLADGTNNAVLMLEFDEEAIRRHEAEDAAADGEVEAYLEEEDEEEDDDEGPPRPGGALL